MRSFKLLNVAILSVLVGSAALVCAQEEKPQEDKPARQEEAKPEPKPNEAKSPRQDEAKPPKQDQDKAMDKQEKQDKQEEKQQRPAQEHEQAMPNRQDHPDQAAHAQAAGKGGHIPDDKFRANFGHSHTFTAKTVIVEGRPQFQYGGYSFQIIDPWPVGWAYTDDCYIDYVDGEYFLFDLLHPGVRIAIFVVM